MILLFSVFSVSLHPCALTCADDYKESVISAVSFFVEQLTVPAKYGVSIHKADHFHIAKHLYVIICKLILFVCELSYQNYSCHGSSCMHHHTQLSMSEGLTHAYPNIITFYYSK